MPQTTRFDLYAVHLLWTRNLQHASVYYFPSSNVNSPDFSLADQLEEVQKFALWVCLKSWDTNHDTNIMVCLQLSSNQRFYWQISSYWMGVGDCEVAWWWNGSLANKIVTWDTFDHASHMCVCVCVCVCLFAITRSNQSFCRQIAGYGMGVGDHRLMVKGITGKHNLIEVHSTMHLMHPN